MNRTNSRRRLGCLLKVEVNTIKERLVHPGKYYLPAVWRGTQAEAAKVNAI